MNASNYKWKFNFFCGWNFFNFFSNITITLKKNEKNSTNGDCNLDHGFSYSMQLQCFSNSSSIQGEYGNSSCKLIQTFAVLMSMKLRRKSYENITLN